MKDRLDPVFYQPIKVAQPLEFEQSYEKVSFKSEDGTQLHGVVLPIEGETKAIILHFHGNYGHMKDPENLDKVDWFGKHGYQVFTFDYRGFGESEGEPSPEGLVKDGIAALRYAQKRWPDKPLFCFAQSLGGNICSKSLTADGLIKAYNISGVILDSTFYSYRSVGSKKLSMISKYTPWLAEVIAWWTLSDAIENNSAKFHAPKLEEPLLMIHVKTDTTVPYSEFESLLEEVKESKPEVETIVLDKVDEPGDNGGHIKAIWQPEVKAQVLGFIEKHMPSK